MIMETIEEKTRRMKEYIQGKCKEWDKLVYEVFNEE